MEYYYLGTNVVVVNVATPNVGPLTGFPRCFPFPDCLVCETNVGVETALTFASINAEYRLLTSQSQLVGHDYLSWASACTGKQFIFTLER